MAIELSTTTIFGYLSDCPMYGAKGPRDMLTIGRKLGLFRDPSYDAMIDPTRRCNGEWFKAVKAQLREDAKKAPPQLVSLEAAVQLFGQRSKAVPLIKLLYQADGDITRAIRLYYDEKDKKCEEYVRTPLALRYGKARRGNAKEIGRWKDNH